MGGALDEESCHIIYFRVQKEILKTMGEQIKLARLRRCLSSELTAERAGISRASLWKVEKGDPSVAMGIYAAVLHALNILIKIFYYLQRMMRLVGKFKI